MKNECISVAACATAEWAVAILLMAFAAIIVIGVAWVAFTTWHELITERWQWRRSSREG